MKTKLTFLQKIGLVSKPHRGRLAKEGKFSIYYGDLNKISGGFTKQSRNEKKFPYTKREKKLSLATVGGAGLGFAVGGLVGGIGGMMLGVPVGTFAGNLIGNKAIPQKGRRPYIQPSYLKRLFTPREELIKVGRDINAIERVRVKSLKAFPVKLYARGKK